MGVIFCIANNMVPPAVAKRIMLNVNCKYYILGTLISVVSLKVTATLTEWLLSIGKLYNGIVNLN